MADGGLLFLMGSQESPNRDLVNPGAGVCIPVAPSFSASLTLGVFTQWDQNKHRDSFVNGKIGLILH